MHGSEKWHGLRAIASMISPPPVSMVAVTSMHLRRTDMVWRSCEQDAIEGDILPPGGLQA